MEVYGILKQLSKGTFGNVHLCEKKHNKQKVVMKTIDCEPSSKKALQAANEARILKMLKHPNIIEYHDSYFKDKVFHIIMEYATHGTLYEFISKNRPNSLSKDWVLSTFCQIVLGLDRIHCKNIIQRDLKTENIFLAGVNGNIIKIGDFGISKTLQNNEKTQTTIGTPNYLAPEICDGKAYDCKSDIWSLGCVLYELCAMERLFDGPVGKVIQNIKIARKKIINIGMYGYALQEIIESAIQLDPQHRPTTRELLRQEELRGVRASFMANLGNYCIPDSA